jgi:hypothetical protein
MTWVTVTAAQVADPGPDPGAEVLDGLVGADDELEAADEA